MHSVLVGLETIGLSEAGNDDTTLIGTWHLLVVEDILVFVSSGQEFFFDLLLNISLTSIHFL